MRRSQGKGGEDVLVGICRGCSVDSRRRKGDEMYDNEIERIFEKEREELNVKKSKVVRFIKGEGREKKMKWWWKRERMEEVKKLNYLRYVFQNNRGMDSLYKEQRKEGRKEVKKGVWLWGRCGRGKRRFGRDWRKRMWLFDALVWSVIGYGVEIWG